MGVVYRLRLSLKVEAAGIEAASASDTHQTPSRHTLDKRPQYQQVIAPPFSPEQTPTGHPLDTLPTQNYAHSMHPDLQEVMQAWPHLPDEIKGQIVALCRTHGKRTA